MSTLDVNAQGPPGARTEQRPRSLTQSDARIDLEQVKTQTFGKHAALSTHPKPYCKPHGDAMPQEPPFHRTWSLDKKKASSQSIIQHPHSKPFSMSTCPGKKESPEGSNSFHRVWLMENGQRGRWNKSKKNDFYTKQDTELMKKIPAEQKFCRTTSNYRAWTHLLDGGLKAGGQEKMDYTYRGPNKSSTHCYLGKYDNVRHVQRIVQTGWRDPITDESRELHKDTRPMFDNRLHDDCINHNKKEDVAALQASFDCFRPARTMSLPQLGADYVKR